MALLDRRQRGQWTREPFSKQACTSGATGAINGGQQTALASGIATAAQQLKISPAGRVDDQVIAMMQTLKTPYMSQAFANIARICHAVGVPQSRSGSGS